MNKTLERLERWIAADGIDFVNEEAAETYRKRAQRMADVVQLKIPDRVPIGLSFGVFPALDNGYTAEEIVFDRDKLFDAYNKAITAFTADTFRFRFAQGHFLEAIESRQVILPGRGISPNSNLQFIEAEYEGADDFYDAFLDDPTDFILRRHWPRIFRGLEPLNKLNPLNTGFSYYLGSVGSIASFGRPGVAEAFQKLCDTGKIVVKEARLAKERSLEIMKMGFPADTGGGAHAPFDTIGDFIRGTKNIMLDMYRHPDKLVAAMERLVPMMIEMGLRARNNLSPFVFIPLHKGIDSFMSLEQYKTFYWPSLRKVVVGLIEKGLIPVLFFEGDNTSRLEVIRDIPRGKAVYHFERVDLVKAKEILGDVVCFRGNVPASLLCTGNPQQVAEYVKRLIDIVGRNGGLIVDSGSIIDEARHENVKAMVDTTKEYGRY